MTLTSLHMLALAIFADEDGTCEDVARRLGIMRRTCIGSATTCKMAGLSRSLSAEHAGRYQPSDCESTGKIGEWTIDMPEGSA